MKLGAKILLSIALLLPGAAMAEGTDAFDKGMEPILKSYLAIQGALAGDSIKGVHAAAKRIAADVKELDANSVTGEHAMHYKDLPTKLGRAAAAVAAATDIAAARAAFKELSKPMAMWGTMSKPKGVVVMFCSMAKGSWLQKKGDTRNPYYGSKMLGCGEVVGGDAGEMGHMGHKHMEQGAHMTH